MMTEEPDDFAACPGCDQSHSQCTCEQPTRVSGPTAGERCPQCNAPTRWVDRGDWRKFMSCSRYPKCTWHQTKTTPRPI